MLSRKNTAIHDLQFDLAKACRAHDDLLATYENKLQEYGIPDTEMNIQPLRVRKLRTKMNRADKMLLNI